MLADMQLRALKPAKKIYKVADRRGLYAAVTPSGADITGTTFNRAFTFDSLRAPVKRGALWLAVFLVMAVICLPGLWVMPNAFRSNVAILSNQPLLDAGSYTLGKRLATTVQFFVDVTGASGTSYLLWDVSLSGNDQQDIVTG